MSELAATLQTIPLNAYLVFCSILFSIGVMGVLLRRNLIIMFMCVELMLNAVNLLFAAFSAYRSDPAGQLFVFFVMVVAAAEIAIGLAILVMIHRNMKSTDVQDVRNLKW